MSYHRILLKLSGEALGERDSGHGIDPDSVASVARQVVGVAEKGVEVAIVCGGGNILRGASFSSGCRLRTVSSDSGRPRTVSAAMW